jgi:hypothetical protein
VFPWQVTYTTHGSGDAGIVSAEPDEDEEHEGDDCCGGGEAAAVKSQLWDLARPLEGSCLLELKTFDDPEGQVASACLTLPAHAQHPCHALLSRAASPLFLWLRACRQTFRHSSAHVLGQSLEVEYGVKLCIGPPTTDGFYYGVCCWACAVALGPPVSTTRVGGSCSWARLVVPPSHPPDAYMGAGSLAEKDFANIKTRAEKIASEKQRFERLVLSKEEVRVGLGLWLGLWARGARAGTVFVCTLLPVVMLAHWMALCPTPSSTGPRAVC